ncbi:MAG TPA: hypothetical protein VIK62_03030 [Verrucomicrobiae bacterium]
MIFLLDHDTPDDLAYSLASLGHQVVRLRDKAGESGIRNNINFA